MSTSKQHLPKFQAPTLSDVRIAIVAAEWNAHINDAMTGSALKTLAQHGVDTDQDVTVMHVPGAVEAHIRSLTDD